ncbi:MAG: class I SAM-dependent RNA methyltransferase [Rhodospirillales bacterium]
MGGKLRQDRRQRRRATAKWLTEGREARLTIESLGGQGDGVGRLQGRPLYVAGALPGEEVRVRLGDKSGRGALLEVLTQAAERREAPCPHFGPCGGCRLQHLEVEAYRTWKRGLLVTALRNRGFAEAEAQVGALVGVPPGRRRRVTWTAQRRAGRIALGFLQEGSHHLVDQTRCLLLLPTLEALLEPLRQLLGQLLDEGQRARVTATDSETGIDLLLGLTGSLDLAARETLASFAEAQDLARLGLSLDEEAPEPLASRRQPWISFQGLRVSLPFAPFLQPSREGEDRLQRAVLAALPDDGAPLADLYAGLGTFSLPLAARGHSVLAVESEAAALTALQAAARATGLEGRLAVSQRNLGRRPLSAAELKPLSALVFDPPKAGAAEQSALLAEAGPPLLVAVSCNPTSFARDAQTLAAGGYRLEGVMPLDQFPWSHHLELVATFRR